MEFDPQEVFKSEKDETKCVTVAPISPNEETVKNSTEPILLLPRFDWIQKLDYITIIFYTGNFSNPMVEVNCIDDKNYQIFLTYDDNVFVNEITFTGGVNWPCQIRVSCETGKIELIYKKDEGKVWDNFGVLKQKAKSKTNSLVETKFKCKVINKVKVNYNTVLIELERNDGNKCVVPLGKHIKVYETIKGNEIINLFFPFLEYSDSSLFQITD